MAGTPLASSSAVSHVLAIALAYAAFVNATGLVLVGLIAGVLTVLGITLSFTILFAIFSYACWRQKTWAYLGAGIVSLVNAAALSFQPPPTPGIVYILQYPSLTGNESFPLFFPYYVALAVTILSGFYGFYTARRPQLLQSQVSLSKVVTLVALGAIVGGLLVGSVAANTESSLLTSAGGHADITIMLGSSDQTNPNFYSPTNFTATVGQAVTWINRDTASHTVTSTTGLFASGNILPGGSFSFTFAKAGTFQYVCTIHPWMKGTIVVSA